MSSDIDTNLSLSVALREKGDLDNSIFHVTMAIKLMRRSRVPDPRLALALKDVANLCWELGRYHRSVYWFTQLERIAAKGSLDQAASLYRIGLGLHLSGRSGVAALLHSQRIVSAIGGENNAALAPILIALGRAYFKENKTALAASCFDEATAKGAVLNPETSQIYQKCKTV